MCDIQAVQEVPAEPEVPVEPKEKVQEHNKVCLISSTTEFVMTPVSSSDLSDEEKAACPLYFCHFCYKTGVTLNAIMDHINNECSGEHPGLIIYDHADTLMLEIDGATHRDYCNNLARFGNLFLERNMSTLRLTDLLFYVLIKREGGVNLAVSFFTKAKREATRHVLRVLVVFPQWSRQGYGRLVIEIAHQMAVGQKLIGYAKFPWSDEFKLAFRSYVKYAVSKYFVYAPFKNFLNGSAVLKHFERQSGIFPLHVYQFLVSLDWVECREEDDKVHLLMNKNYMIAVLVRLREAGRFIEFNKSSLKWKPNELSPVNKDWYTARSCPALAHLAVMPNGSQFMRIARELNLNVDLLEKNIKNGTVDRMVPDGEGVFVDGKRVFTEYMEDSDSEFESKTDEEDK